MLKEADKHKILEITSRYRPEMVGIYGSYARGEEHSGSDLDILIEFSEDVSLLDIIGLEQELSEALGLKVEVVTKKSINPKMEPYISRDLIRLD